MYDVIEYNVVELLKKYNLTISFAESCTCGLLASKIGNVPGASSVFNESYVTYANKSKTKILGVKEKTLQLFGAVSEETAKEMAEGLQRVTGADVSIAVTGIAGPDGGTKEKPVGLVFVAVNFDGKTTIYKLNLKGDRQKIREEVCAYSLNYVRLTIKEKYHD
ncbi:MAG: CinA family protein [Clostridia bacterium]|nr:CinA family protein [Clostridia bacterium]